MAESEIMRAGWLAMVKNGAKIWRNNVGMGISGKFRRLQNGDFIVEHGRPIKFGLCQGSPDLVGYISTTVSAEMIGMKIAIFVGAECKTESGSIAKEQIEFLEMARKDGALSFVFRTPSEAIDKLHQGNLNV